MPGDFLAGVRVLDLSQFLPGPFATQMLADLGADVLKVEPPAGDPLRRLDPTTGQPGPADGRSPYYDAVNAGKAVVALDLKSADGKRAFETLVRAADVLLESYRPGVLDRLGFTRARLKEINRGLVHCALSGYGQTGPNRLRAGHDINYVASVGAYSASGIPERPVMAWPPAADYGSALTAALTIAGALLARARTGQGAYLDVSLAESMLAWQAWGLTAARAAAEAAGEGPGGPARGGNLLNGGAASYQVYATKDGRFVTLGALEAHFWASFCDAVGRPDWTARQHEPLPQTDLIAEVAALFAAEPLQHWEALLKDVDCCYHAVLDYAEVVRDPHVAARGLLTGGEGAEKGKGGGPWAGVLFPAIVDGRAPGPRPPVRELDLETALGMWA
ncbi:MAG: CaiB/BaiF CoA transferase family protein [Rhodospirillales bacterium]